MYLWNMTTFQKLTNSAFIKEVIEKSASKSKAIKKVSVIATKKAIHNNTDFSCFFASFFFYIFI